MIYSQKIENQSLYLFALKTQMADYRTLYMHLTHLIIVFLMFLILAPAPPYRLYSLASILNPCFSAQLIAMRYFKSSSLLVLYLTVLD
jgi:hypothetical protein